MNFGLSSLFYFTVFIFSVIVMAVVLVIYRKIRMQLKISSEHEEELKRKVYETEVLKEINERVGYSLDGAKIIEIIAGSLDKILSFSTICYIIFKKGEKVTFACRVNETVGNSFIQDVRSRMIKQSSELIKQVITNSDLDESLSGGIMDDSSKEPVSSYFDLPIYIGEKLIGIISVASTRLNLYDEKNTEVLRRIASQASDAATKLQVVLENEKAKLAQAVQSLSDGILMVNTNYDLVLINKKLSQLLGIIERPQLFDIVNALSGSLDLRSLMEEAIAEDGELPVREIVVKERVLQVVASKVMEKHTDKPMGVIVLFRDITAAKSLEKLRADFTSMMVHELRAPLTSIKSTVELLSEDLIKIKPQEANKYLGNIKSTSQEMLEVVNDLLDVAKMESGSFDVVVEKGQVAELVVDRVAIYETLANVRNLKITSEIEDNLPEAFFDKVRIKQVLNNLFSNALKFTHSGEVKVKVAAIREGEVVHEIVVSVVDSGIGIDPEEGRKLFSRFGQLVRSRRTAALKGSGLGLYIAKGIVEAWGGRIWYKSDGAGMGSSFYFTVPVVMPKSDIIPSDSHLSNLKQSSKVAQA